MPLAMTDLYKKQPSAPPLASNKDPKGRVRPLGTGAARMTELLETITESGDQDAFAELFAYYAPRVKAYMIRLGAVEGQADELAQEALLTVWRKARLFDRKKASAGTWIFTIARNLRIDAIRREKRPEFDYEDPALVPDPEPSADTEVQRGEEQVLVREALGKLSKEQAAVVRLSFFEDMSHSAIAEKLGIPLGTVKSRLRLACARIHALLENVV